MRSQQHTIVLSQDDSVFRVDFLVRPQQTPQIADCRQVADTHLPLAQAVKQSLHQGTRPRGKVWILTNTAWTGTVSLENAVVAAIDSSELEQAIGIEAEFDSGLSPFESRQCAQPHEATAAESVWSVLQLAGQDLADVESAAKSQGLWLSGIAAMPRPTNADSHQLTSQDAEQIAQDWLQAHLAAPELSLFIPGDNAELRTRRERRILAAAMFASILACFVAQVWLQNELRLASKQHTDWVARTTHSEARLNGDRKAIQRLDQSRRELKEQLEKSERLVAARRLYEVSQAARRNTASQLMDGLQATAKPQHWIQHLHLDNQVATLSGVALSTTDVIQLAASLQAALTAGVEAGGGQWLVEVEKTEQQSKLVAFELRGIQRLPTQAPARVSGVQRESSR